MVSIELAAEKPSHPSAEKKPFKTFLAEEAHLGSTDYEQHPSKQDFPSKQEGEDLGLVTLGEEAEEHGNKSTHFTCEIPPWSFEDVLTEDERKQIYATAEDRHLGNSENIVASPSAPPMAGSSSFESNSESVNGPSISQSVGQIYDSGGEEWESPVRQQKRSSFEEEQMTETCFSSKQAVRQLFGMEGEDFDSTARQTVSLTNQQPCFRLSGHAAWQALIAYDACVRLCLRAWAKGCIEAPEFLINECAMLRSAFGLQHLLLQPHEDVIASNRDSNGADAASVSKLKGNAGKIKVQVRKIRSFSRQGLQGSSSQRSPAYMQVGAQYVRQVSDMVKTGVKNILSTTLDTQDVYSCLLWLRSTESGEGVLTHPGAGGMHVFNPESTADHLLLEVQDARGNAQGRGVVHLSSLTDDPNDRVRWWPVFNDVDHECVGKVQLFITYCANLTEDSSKKCGPVGETLAYDIVLEVAMRAQFFQKRNLRLNGPWKWLLSEFASFYGVSNVYTSLRYLACVMEVATPTEDCLVLIHDLLFPVVRAQAETTFTRQEKRILSEVEDHVEQLLASVFENYKYLDESSPSGLTETLTELNGKAAPALVAAVQIFTLLHDILSVEAQKTLCNYFLRAAKKRCRRLMADSDEFVTGSSNEGFLMDPMTTTTAYAKLKALCVNMCNEVKMDIELHNQHILPSSIDLPNITADIYCMELSERLKSFLVACPPSGPSASVVDLLIATAGFQQDLLTWKISPLMGGRVDAKDLFHLYIVLWIQDRRLCLLDFCKLEKVRWTGATTSNGTSLFAEEMYDRIKDTLNEYDVLLNYWPEYTSTLESAIADVETALVATLEKQYADALAPLKDVMITKKFTLQYMQKLTRRSIALYSVPNQLGTFLNTIKRLLDTLRPKIDAHMKTWVACIPVETNSKVCFGERLNEVTILLRAKYKTFIQAVVEKLSDNSRLQATTKLKKILQEAGGESEVRERMQPLSIQLSETIVHLHDVFTPRVFVAICQGYWDRMGQDVLHFLENRKENRLWYKGSYFALSILDDLFASQMQKLQGHALQEKDVHPPRSVMEARSMLCRDAPNCADSSNYLYF